MGLQDLPCVRRSGQGKAYAWRISRPRPGLSFGAATCDQMALPGTGSRVYAAAMAWEPGAGASLACGAVGVVGCSCTRGADGARSAMAPIACRPRPSSRLWVMVSHTCLT